MNDFVLSFDSYITNNDTESQRSNTIMYALDTRGFPYVIDFIKYNYETIKRSNLINDIRNNILSLLESDFSYIVELINQTSKRDVKKF